MAISSLLSQIVDELRKTVDQISDEEGEVLVGHILQSKRIFLAGAGRSGLMAKSFAMRLMHMGFDSYVVGETVTKGFEKEDLLIIASGSGETKSLVQAAEKARTIGGKVALITINPQSSIGHLSDITVKLPGSPKDQSGSGYKTIQPMGSLFEQTLLLFLDCVILKIMDQKGMDSAVMYGSHANLE
ncbi:6-phospho-3-hexuloisomerase [Peribacillus deserti]|uniref:6-phospho-3-hexuloisomerase n=1 Tax=Peribacillus deserti TaxID=673318 RepID=A0ABS2QMU4_9BACI|nr:6-phospho-3-hexuloisomerase [Peribacillus deserti]MBM7694502.1 6-phospho-3-hexuloisomerase [Peribacillus deserti]